MMSHILKIFCTLACVFSSPGYAQSEAVSVKTVPIIKKISITGSRKITEKSLLQNLYSKKDRGFDRNALDRDLKEVARIYTSKNFYLAQIDSVQCTFSVDSSEVSIRIFITENKAIEIGRIEFIGNAFVSSSGLLNVMNSDLGKIFDPAVLEQDLEDIVRLYEDRGFPFTRIAVTELRLYEESSRPKVSLTMTVEENKKTLLTRLDVRGQQQTRESILLREMRLSLPRWYRRSDIDAGLARLRRFSFINDATEGPLNAVNDSAYALQISVTEGPSNTIDGVAGYVPKTAASKGYFTGFANLSFQNLFGTARRLDVRWQKKNRYSQDFLLAYTEPWILGYPVNLGGSIGQLVQDTIYVERQFTLDGNVWIGTYGAGLFGAKLKYIDPSDAATGFVYNIPTAQFTSAYIGISYDTRDNPYNPRTGAFYRAMIEYGQKKEDYFIAGNGARDTLYINGQPVAVEKKKRSIATQKLTLDFETIFSVTRKFVLYNGVHGITYKSPQNVVPYSEQIRFGGLKTVRGYTEDFFNGTRAGWNNFELRWLTAPRSRLFVFLDLGYYYRRAYSSDSPVRITKQDGWPLGYGFGMRFETKLGLFALDFGLGRNDSFSEGKIHFGIASEF